MSMSEPPQKVEDLEKGEDRNEKRDSTASIGQSEETKTSPPVAVTTTPVAPPAAPKNEFEVGWDGPDDPENPQNWSETIRWYYTVLAGALILNATFASTAPVGIIPQLEKHFEISSEVATLVLSLFVAGYCVGPIVWGPLSETIGRRPVFIGSFVVYMLFQIGCALSPNVGAILAFRFLGGCLAASPLSNSGAVIADIWAARQRGQAMAIFAIAPFAGPTLAPAISGFIGVSGTSWRWVFWILTLFAAVMLALIIFTLPETYAPILLKNKAARKRKETGDERWFAPIEARKLTLSQHANNIITKPALMFIKEPMLFAVTMYMSFVYGCIYLLFEAYPVIFGKGGHNFNAGIQGLMFLPLLGGGVFGGILSATYYNKQYVKKMGEYAPARVPPEYRLRMCLTGGIIFAASFFWIGWTSYPWISFWAPMMSGFPLGYGLILIFQGLQNFLVDCYLMNAATALAVLAVVRSSFGAAFPLFARQMYDKLNARWASTLLGGIAILMTPIPALFIRYGHLLRQKSRYTPKF
ncbi:MFS general substrate transporter [Clavulina sp. PMI_390]|nr:MFS general substrate transporter [Clavulina sp. PMI_390]